ncbi:MAG TPA: DUF4233 domain-containing protein [Galbitalea sp.]|nr:DUF4233 domain-containing protein [Galbitalea sp.]
MTEPRPVSASDGKPPRKPPRQGKQRRQRSLTESLLSIVLGLEAVLVFFIALTVYGLHALPPLEAFCGGAGLVILLALATRIVRYPWGVWVGWVLQVALLATGILLPALYIAAALFVALWIFCFVRARQIEHANRSSSDPADGHPISTEGTHS